MDIAKFICQEIAKVPDRGAKFESDRIWIRCPYHKDGKERTPSFSINLNPDKALGFGYCFGCKEKRSFNELAKDLGISGIKASKIVHGVGSVNFDFVSMDGEDDKPRLKDMLAWPNQDWRGINGDTLALFDARLEIRFKEVHMYLPVMVRKEYVGGIHCKIHITQEDKDRGIKSYINTTGAWSHSSVFGYNLAKQRKGPLIVVEGPRDTLKVAQLGGRVVGMLGAAVSDEKVRLIESLDPPYVIVLFDPDEAGDKAAFEIKKKLNRRYIKNIRIRLPEGRDPANLTGKSIEKVYSIAREGLNV